MSTSIYKIFLIETRIEIPIITIYGDLALAYTFEDNLASIMSSKI